MSKFNHSTQELRIPFDEQDQAIAEAFCRSRNLSMYDPFPGEGVPNDLLFTPSLIMARHHILHITEDLRRRDGTSCRIYPTFIIHNQVNAFAKEINGVGICAIYNDLALVVHEISHFVFTQATFFREIGNVNSEISPRLPDDFQIGFWNLKYFESGMPSYMEIICQKLLPVDPDRMFMAYMLYQLMMRFIWFHELFHVVNGHTGYLSHQHKDANRSDSENESIHLSETEVVTSSRQLKRIRYALESDADRSAISQMYLFQQQNDEPLDNLAKMPRRLRLQLTVLAGLLTTFVFDKISNRDTYILDRVSNWTPAQGNATHPTSMSRLQNMIVTLASYDDKTDETIDVVDSVFDEIERIRHNLAGVGLFSPTRVKYFLHTNYFQNNFRKEERFLANIKKKLIPFCYT